MPPKSKAQARYLGAVAAGTARLRGGPTRAQAREMLRGAKLKRLPERKRKRSSARARPRTKTGRFRRR